MWFDNDTALNVENEYQYSRIGMINNKYKHFGYYEYLLEYPEYKGFNRWKQAYHMAETNQQQTSEDLDYHKVEAHYTNGSFGGLSRSLSYRNTTFDGSPGIGSDQVRFWYAIAPYTYYKQEQNRFPGPSPHTVTLCYLWIRVYPLTNNAYKNTKCLLKSFLLYAMSLAES